MVDLEIVSSNKASAGLPTNISNVIHSESNFIVKSITAPISIEKSAQRNMNINMEENFQSLSPKLAIGNKPLLIVYMPNQQRTIVSVNCGQTLREALARAMKKRLLTVDMCCVIYHSNE